MGFRGGMGGMGRREEYAVFAGSTEKGKRKVSDIALLKRLFHYAGLYQRHLFLIIISTITSSLCNTSMPYLQSIAIDQIISKGDYSGFIWWLPLFAGVATITFLAQYLQLCNVDFIGENVVSELREDMMTRLQILSLRYFAEGETGRVMSKITNDAEAVRLFIRMGITTCSR